MSDRRQPSDRRHLIPRIGGRRRTDSAPSHGTRANYRKGCACIPCKAAEAAYRANLRLQKAKGLPVLGSLISASEAWARIRVLQMEGCTARQITGWADPHAFRFTAQSRIRLMTLLRLRRVCAFYTIPNNELPMHTPHQDEP